MKPPKPLGKGYKSITVVLKAPCFYVNLVKAPRPDLNLKAARLQHGGLQTQSIYIYTYLLVAYRKLRWTTILEAL